MSADVLPACNTELASLLTQHQDELNNYLQEWSQRQNSIIASVLMHPNRDSTEEQLQKSQSKSEDDAESNHKLPATEPEDIDGKQNSTSEPTGVVPSSTDVRPSVSGHQDLGMLDEYDQAKVVAHNTAHTWLILAQRRQVERWETRKNGHLQRLIHSMRFEVVSITVVVANAFLMACSVDYTLAKPRQARNMVFQTFELSLSGYYLIEVLLRLLAEQGYFFFAPHSNWNCLDLFLVCFSMYEMIMEYSQPGGGGNLSFLRILRVCKMLKMIRLLRVLRTFRELRLIMASMLGSMRTMLWSVMLIVVITFMVSLFLMQNVASYVVENSGSLDPQFEASLDKYWSSMTTAMTSLYMSSTGGESWIFVAEPLKTVGQPFFICFMVYVAFFMFVIVNTLTSIFIEAAMANAEKDHKEMIQQEMKKKHEYIALIKQLFSEMDKDGKGRITRDAFMANLHNSQMVAFLSRVGIDAIDAEGFFDILASEAGTGGIDVEAFVLGCMKLRGPARSMDLLGLIHKHDASASRVRKFLSDSQSTLDEIHEQMTRLIEANDGWDKKLARTIEGKQHVGSILEAVTPSSANDGKLWPWSNSSDQEPMGRPCDKKPNESPGKVITVESL